jgi:ribonuclease VapC
MVIDTSALLAILDDEPERRAFNECIQNDPKRFISAATLLETGIVVEARRGEAGGRELDLLLHRSRFEVVPVDADQAEIARAAFRVYGKGRHTAGLNFGDCFAYALARELDEPLLYKGSDFAKTDLPPATWR